MCDRPGNPLSPEGWPLTREGWLEDSYRAPDPLNEVSVFPIEVETVAKRYAEGRLLIHVHIQFFSRQSSDSENARRA